MIVALVQLRLNARSRAANVQGLTTGIERAAQANPAPDLLVLPGACDTGGAAPGSDWSQAGVDGIAQTIAWKAREWGVFIAAGLYHRSGEGITPHAVIFDPDGDIVARSGAWGSPEEQQAVGPVELWSSAVGSMGVVTPQVDASWASYVPEENPGLFLAFPLGPAATTGQRRAREVFLSALGQGPPATGGAYWGVVAAATPAASPEGTGPRTFACGPDGRVLVSAAGPTEEILYAEIPLVPVPLALRAGLGKLDRHAD